MFIWHFAAYQLRAQIRIIYQVTVAGVTEVNKVDVVPVLMEPTF